ncbi:hypothetical protein ACOSP7_026588 [Xanthoceras sorbifolium]
MVNKGTSEDSFLIKKWNQQSPLHASLSNNLLLLQGVRIGACERSSSRVCFMPLSNLMLQLWFLVLMLALPLVLSLVLSYMHDISSVLQCFNVSFVSFAPRDCNKVAHAMAKLALSLESDLFLMDCVPL